MKSLYWIKLYTEVVDDPKMGQLTDHLFRRTIELFCLAGKENNKGKLPPLNEIVWKLHTDLMELQVDLKELEAVGILTEKKGDWIVTKFAERQAPSPAKERMKEYRKRKKREVGYEDVTIRNNTPLHTGYETVTESNSNVLRKRYAPVTETAPDTESELNNTEKEKKRPTPTAIINNNHLGVAGLYIFSLYKVDPDSIPKTLVNRVLKLVNTWDENRVIAMTDWCYYKVEVKDLEGAIKRIESGIEAWTDYEPVNSENVDHEDYY